MSMQPGWRDGRASAGYKCSDPPVTIRRHFRVVLGENRMAASLPHPKNEYGIPAGKQAVYGRLRDGVLKTLCVRQPQEHVRIEEPTH
jgi:hypothetical protein